jgi:parvulin-like peptidyl-prolyl isomerase
MTRQKISAALFAPLIALGLLAMPACKPNASQPSTDSSPNATPGESASATATPAAVQAPNTDIQPGEEKPKADAKPLELPEVVATVNGQPIKREQLQEVFNAAIEASGAKLQDLTTQQQLNGYTQLLQELIMEKLVDEASASQEVSQADVDAEIAKIKGQFPDPNIFEEQLKATGQTPEKLSANIRSMLRQQRWLQSEVKTPEVTEAEAKTFYDSNQAEFEQPETVKASHILFLVDQDAPEDVVKQKQAAATKAAERANKGEDFNKLAQELSEEPGAKDSGGDLGFFPKDRMVPEFANAAFSQEINTISVPVRSQFGWHVIKVTDKKAAGTVPFSDVKDQIIAYLKSSKQREAFQSTLNKLKEAAKIETFLPAES